MASIVPCIPPEMGKALRELEKEGWRINCARGDTGWVVASYYGSARPFFWDGTELRSMTIREAVDLVREAENAP
jgi:hypothetical protein